MVFESLGIWHKGSFKALEFRNSAENYGEIGLKVLEKSYIPPPPKKNSGQPQPDIISSIVKACAVAIIKTSCNYLFCVSGEWHCLTTALLRVAESA